MIVCCAAIENQQPWQYTGINSHLLQPESEKAEDETQEFIRGVAELQVKLNSHPLQACYDKVRALLEKV